MNVSEEVSVPSIEHATKRCQSLVLYTQHLIPLVFKAQHDLDQMLRVKY
jgi:hypothetical protein